MPKYYLDLSGEPDLIRKVGQNISCVALYHSINLTFSRGLQPRVEGAVIRGCSASHFDILVVYNNKYYKNLIFNKYNLNF